MPKVHKGKDLCDGILTGPSTHPQLFPSRTLILSKLKVAVVLAGSGVFLDKVISLIH